ncbi:unnamed protein product, partial [marine sediment metagenome]
MVMLKKVMINSIDCSNYLKKFEIERVFGQTI